MKGGGGSAALSACSEREIPTSPKTRKPAESAADRAKETGIQPGCSPESAAAGSRNEITAAASTTVSPSRRQAQTSAPIQRAPTAHSTGKGRRRMGERMKPPRRAAAISDQRPGRKRTARAVSSVTPAAIQTPSRMGLPSSPKTGSVTLEPAGETPGRRTARE